MFQLTRLSTRSPRRAAFALTLALAITAAACGGDDDAAPSADDSSVATDIDTASDESASSVGSAESSESADVGESTGSTEASGGTITTAWPADITSLDPTNLSTAWDQELTRNLYQTLALPVFTEQDDGSLKFDGANVSPYLAESWTLDDTSITFHLRDGVTFYETGNPLTAADVKFSLDRVFASQGAGDLQANGLQGPDDIHVVDDMTVRVDFKTVDGEPTPVTPTLIAIFGQFYTGIVDSAAVEPHLTADDPVGAEWLRVNAAGTGPYYIASRDPGSEILLKAVPDGWAPAPSFTDVEIRITSGSVSSLLQNGDINFGEFGMTNQQVEALAEEGLGVFWENTGHFDMFAITAAPEDEVGVLADPLVRQAIAYALPYDEILENIVYGRGERAYSIVAPSAPEYTDAWSAYTTDIDKAKELMDEAGNPEIDMPLHYLQGNEDQTNTAILIQASLSQIGIDTTLTPETAAGLFDVLNSRSTPAAGAPLGPPGFELFNWSAWTDDPKIVIGYWATTGGINNYALWADPEVDAINEEFALQTTSDERTAAYQKAQEIIAADAAYIPIVQTGAIAVVEDGIEGVSFSPGGSGRFWTLTPAGTTNELVATVIGS